LGRIIGCPVPNRVYGPNNPLGNECYSEIMNDIMIYYNMIQDIGLTNMVYVKLNQTIKMYPDDFSSRRNTL